MVTRIFSYRISIILLTLLLVEFFHFTYLPGFLRYVVDVRIFFIILFMLFFSYIEKNKLDFNSKCSKIINRLMALLLIFALVNCIVCYHYRHQGFFETLVHWSPIFMLYLYYPFRKLKLSITDWEKIIYTLFMMMVVIEIIMNLFPELMLFDMTSGDDKFENELRVRVFADGILVLGNLFCLNKAIVGIERIKYTFLYILSLLLIFLTGFRMIDLACIVALFYMLAKFKMLKLRYVVIGTFVTLLLVGIALSTPIVQERIEEMKERNETDNFDNDDYIRVLLVTYYYTEYFKNNVELFFGSGMVERQILVGAKDNVSVKNSSFKSEYSKEVSYLSDTYHFFPIDMGLIGLSWEAGIPAAIIIVCLLLYMFLTRTEKEYFYISVWALVLLLISWNNPKVYHHHNMIYLSMVLVILGKVARNKETNNSKRHLLEVNDRNS